MALLRALVMAAGMTGALLAGAEAAQARPFYEGYVKLPGRGPVHSAVQGDGWTTVFKERAKGTVRYRVCLTHRPTKNSRCWTRTTHADGTSVVFVALFVNDHGGPGAWRATFTVRGKRVAGWDFAVSPEPEG